MRLAWFFSLAILFGLAHAPTLTAQDFLKQLEEKIFQKQQESKSKEPPSEQLPGSEMPSDPIEDRAVLEPEGLPAPGEVNPNPNNEPMELPSPAKRTEPKRSTTARPSKPPANDPSGTGDKPIPSPFPKSTTKNSKPSNASKMPAVQPPIGGGGFLGLTVEATPGGGFGLTVVEIAPNSPAWKAGFKVGDRVIGVGGYAVSTVDEFAAQLAKYAPGSAVKFSLDRRGRDASLIAVLQDRLVAGKIQGARPGTAFDLNVPNAGARSGRAFFGVNVSDMSDGFRKQFGIPAYRGASVTEVIANSPAAAAGLKPGDCIVEMDGKTIQTADAVFDTIMRSKPGQVIAVSYFRGGLMSTASVVLISENEDLNSMGASASISPEMLTPEYVSGLHSELERVTQELSQAQARLQQLEARLQSLENKR